MEEISSMDIKYKEFGSGSDVLLICFAGVRYGYGIPDYEFEAFLRNENIKACFVKDIKNRWYLDGIEGLHDPYTVFVELSKIRSNAKVKYVVCVGNSMGGFAALWYGAWLGANLIHAFVPQVTVDRKVIPDYRWDRSWNEIDELYHLNALLYPQMRDLGEGLKPYATKDQHYVLHFGTESQLDRQHANHFLSQIDGRTNIQLRSYPGDHRLVRSLKEDGHLRRLLIEEPAKRASEW